MPSSSEPASPLTPEECEELKVGGLKVQYAVLCPRKAWLYAKGLRMESLSDAVALGRLLHQTAYEREQVREALIDDLIKIDIIDEGAGSATLVEVKRSSRAAEAARIQLGYYLLYLARRGADGLVGELRFPRERRREEVRLTPELEARVREVLRTLRDIEERPTPPQAAYGRLCRTCAYAELCWG